MKNKNDCFRSLNTGLPEDIARLKSAGYFDAAIELIDMRLAEDWTISQNSRPYQGLEPSGENIAPNPMSIMPMTMRESLTVQREIMQLLPLHYCYTEEEAFCLLQTKISDFTQEEFDTLFYENRLDWHFVNGAPHIAEDFYDSLIDTDAGYAQRAGTPHSTKRNAMRTALLEKMQQEGSMTARYTLCAKLKASDAAFKNALIAAKAKGKDTVTVRAWMPFPAVCDTQSDILLCDAMPKDIASIAPENAPARSVYWSFEATENPNFMLKYAYTQTAKYITLPKQGSLAEKRCEVESLVGGASAENKDDFSKDLVEQEPHICFTPYLRALVAELTDGITCPLEKARAIYDYITFNVHYRYMPPYFTLEKIAETCAVSRRGDCGVMAVTFITMCRIAGIPAQWESGLMVREGDAGCHDWARFYVEPYGWLYADCSFGSSAAREESELRRTHYFGNLDAQRMVANRTFAPPLSPEKYSWRADPCDNQVGELEFEGIGLFGHEVTSEVIVVSVE